MCRSISVVLDADDPRLDPYRDLPDRALARDDGRFVCEGRWLVDRLLVSAFPVESILISDDGEPPEWVPDGVPVYAAPKRVIEKSVGYKFHRGALAVSRRREPMPVEALIQRLPAKAVITTLVGVHDPDNVGAMVRCSAGLGAAAILVDGQTHDLFYRRALRAAMGTTLFMPIAKCEDINDALSLLKGAGIQTVATVARPVGERMGGLEVQPIGAVAPEARAAVLLGTEGPGLTEEVVAGCDAAVTIPMHARTDSLNVGAATAVFLYEWTRARPGEN